MPGPDEQLVVGLRRPPSGRAQEDVLRVEGFRVFKGLGFFSGLGFRVFRMVVITKVKEICLGFAAFKAVTVEARKLEHHCPHALKV